MNEPANDGSGIVGKAAHAAGTASTFALGVIGATGLTYGVKSKFTKPVKTDLNVHGVVNENIKKPTNFKNHIKNAPQIKYKVKNDTLSDTVLSTISSSGDNTKKISLDLKSKKNAKKIRSNIKPSRSSAGTFKKIKNFLKK